ncbi:MAG TPA: MerR family transcriptional regulator [Nannocystis sp.]
MSDPEQTWATTAELAAAAQVHPATITRWVKLELLPKPEIVNMGRWGRSIRYPLSAVEQARWVRTQLERRRSFAEIREMLQRGDFKPSSSSKDP